MWMAINSKLMTSKLYHRKSSSAHNMCSFIALIEETQQEKCCYHIYWWRRKPRFLWRNQLCRLKHLPSSSFKITDGDFNAHVDRCSNFSRKVVLLESLVSKSIGMDILACLRDNQKKKQENMLLPEMPVFWSKQFKYKSQSFYPACSLQWKDWNLCKRDALALQAAMVLQRSIW